MPLWIAPCTWTQDAQISKLLRGLWKSPQGSIVDIRDDMGTSSHLISCQVGVQNYVFFSNFYWTQPRIQYHRVVTGLLWGSSIFGTMSEPPGETRTTAVCCPASLTHLFLRRKESHPCTRAFGLLCWASCHMSLGLHGFDGLHRWPAEWRITFSRFRAKLLRHMRHFFCTESISNELRWGWYCKGLWHRGGCEAGKLALVSACTCSNCSNVPFLWSTSQTSHFGSQNNWQFFRENTWSLGAGPDPSGSQWVPVSVPVQAGLSFMAYETLKAQIAEDGDLGVHQRLRLGNWKWA